MEPLQLLHSIWAMANTCNTWQDLKNRANSYTASRPDTLLTIGDDLVIISSRTGAVSVTFTPQFFN